MKVNWTPEEAHTKRPHHAHTKLAWVLWVLGAAIVITWVAGMAAGVPFGKWTYLLLGVFVGLLLASIALGFGHVEYLEPMKVARRRIMRSRHGRAPQKPKVE
jgi:hypothetical protein